MKRTLFSILMMCVLVITITGCGSKLDKTGEEFKNAIIKEESEIDEREYKESDFSFLIYKDKDTNRYLAEVWVPYEGEPSDLKKNYFYNEDKELEEESQSTGSLEKAKSYGNYEVVYKSGKFE
ncbi:hypothetical protein Q1H93_002854 [Enterococcus faecalis]|nr:hypothetical protein [Enterococcus faecalis]